MKRPTFKTTLLALGMVASLPLASAAAPPEGVPGEPQFVPNELIVLLDHGPIVPTPEAVVESVNKKRQIPDGLGVGNPVASRFMVSDRAPESARARFEENPERPEAILQRYVVMTYPAVVDLDKIQMALEMNPNVLWVGKNSYARLSATEPNDPFFNDNPGGILRPANQHQWGSYSLRLPDAWDYTKGHSYVAIVDTGTDTDHPDLKPFDASNNFIGGNFRAHLSRDYGYDDDNVDEGETQGAQTVSFGGHGTHVSGIVGATANNAIGVAGSCWNCSLLISKVSRISGGVNAAITRADLVDGINGSIGRGAQILNLSLGYEPGDPNRPDCVATPLDAFCVALQLLHDRDTVMTAAAGNDGGGQASDFPASDSRVVGVGGIEPDGSFFDDCPGFECGSNVNPAQIVTPAKQVYSTFYVGLTYSPSGGCDDSVDGTVDGYGLCTGTSMSAPYAAGSAGILRSADPLLTKGNIKGILINNLDNPPGWNTANGVGKPHVANAVKVALGKVNNVQLNNRLTPLFQLYSTVAEDHVYTTFPQMATAFQWSSSDYWSPISAPQVGGYGPYFPGGKTCQVGPCIQYARASVYIFTTPNSPNAVPLVPLYRLSFAGTFPGGPANPNNRDHTYTTEAAGIKSFVNAGYKLDGIEGYIYKRCTTEPSCIPAGAVRLYRYYNATKDDWAIFPESELASWTASGYAHQAGTNAWIGYVYPNTDTDGDWVINGFEGLVGTNPNSSDSDCDGLTDGTELLKYPRTDPEIGSC